MEDPKLAAFYEKVSVAAVVIVILVFAVAKLAGVSF